MASIVAYISNKIEEGLRILKFTRNGRSDTVTSYLGAPFGEDFVPPKNAKMVQIRSTNSEESVIVCVINQADDSLKEGEKLIYSTDANGNVKSKIYLRDDGTVEVKGSKVEFLEGEDFAVRYTALESQFNELNDKYNDLVSKWNAFSNAYVPGGPTAVGLPPTASSGSASTADITLTKVEEINLP